MHLTRASEIQSCLDSLSLPVLSGSRSMLSMPSSAQLSAVLAFRAGKAKARYSTPLSMSPTRDFGRILLDSGIEMQCGVDSRSGTRNSSGVYDKIQQT